MAQKVKEEMEKKQKIEEETLKEREEDTVLLQFERQLDSLNSGITAALNAVEEGNLEMGEEEEMKKKNFDMDKLKLSQAKDAKGIKRKKLIPWRRR